MYFTSFKYTGGSFKKNNKIFLKACTLKRIQKHPPEGDTFSTSDSTTYYDDDDMSCSDESSPDVGEYYAIICTESQKNVGFTSKFYLGECFGYKAFICKLEIPSSNSRCSYSLLVRKNVKLVLPPHIHNV